jgi:hypothetical protein
MTFASTVTEAPEATQEVSLAHYIGGQWEREDGPTFPVVNPSTGQELGKAPIASRETVDSAVQSAKSALEAWRLTTPKEREEYLHKLADLVQASGHDLAILESLNVGRPLSETLEEIPPLPARLFSCIWRPGSQGCRDSSHGPAGAGCARGYRGCPHPGSHRLRPGPSACRVQTESRSSSQSLLRRRGRVSGCPPTAGHDPEREEAIAEVALARVLVFGWAMR